MLEFAITLVIVTLMVLISVAFGYFLGVTRDRNNE